MLSRKLWSFCRGYVIIKARGPQLEKFLNLAGREGVSLWEVRRPVEDTLIARVELRGLERLRAFARRTGTEISFKRRRGLPFLVATLRRRGAWTVGALAFFAALAVLSSYIWFVRLEGAPARLRPRLQRELKALGLVPGVRKGQLRTKELAERLLERHPELAWAGVEFYGTLARVRVVPRELPPPPQNQPCDLVARRDGVITRVITYTGQALVQPGQTVRKGEALISGHVLYRPDPANPLSRRLAPPAGGEEGKATQTGNGAKVPPTVGPFQHLQVRASGVVEARVGYEGYAEVPLNGASRTEALERARALAWAKVARQLPRGARIETRRWAEIPGRGEEKVVRVRALAEVIEDIGTVRALGPIPAPLREKLETPLGPGSPPEPEGDGETQIQEERRGN